jgi:hypothetical protein
MSAAGRATVRPTARRRPTLWAAAALAGLAIAGASRIARAQSSMGEEVESESQLIEGDQRYHSPQRFAFELKFGPYRPDVDGEFNGDRHPYQDYFGSGSHLMTRLELDYEFFHRVGSLAAGFGVGYFQVSGTAPVANGTGLPSGDQSTFKVIPLSLSAVYRFDYLLEKRNFPLVPYGKLGLDYAYWQITDGNDEIASDGRGGHGRGGTLGWHAAAGIALVLDMFDPEAAHDFDADLGVNHTALVFEYSYADISGLGASNRLHVGDNSWSLGLLMEF